MRYAVSQHLRADALDEAVDGTAAAAATAAGVPRLGCDYASRRLRDNDKYLLASRHDLCTYAAYKQGHLLAWQGFRAKVRFVRSIMESMLAIGTSNVSASMRLTLAPVFAPFPPGAPALRRT